MTSDSKENLLKIITNKQTGTPGSESLDLHEENTSINITSNVVFQYNNMLIIIDNTNYKIKMYDIDENLVFEQDIKINNNSVSGNWTMDEEGNIYGIHYYNSKYYLAYWNNPTIKVQGNYVFKVKVTYDINSVIQEATIRPGSTFQFSGGMFAGFSKCPFDSRFVIFVTAFAGNILDMYNFTAITYQVNVGSENTYSFVHSTTGSDFMYMLDFYEEWTNNNCKFTCAVMGQSSSLPALPATRTLYQYTGQINSGSISASSWSISNNVDINYKYIDATHAYGIVKSNTSSTLTTELYYINGTWSDRVRVKKIETTPAKYSVQYPILENESYASDNFIPFVTDNKEIFFLQIHLKEATGYWENIIYSTNFLHVKDGEILGDYELDDTKFVATLYFYIKLDFNLYTAYLRKSTDTTTYYKLIFVYNQDSYNGTPYVNNNMLKGNGGIIKKDNVPIFARDLYNAEQINNQITNIVQIPNYYLNNELDTTQELIGQTNQIISDTDIVIDKNQYEQVFLTWLEQIKVFNNNNGSIYNQQATYKLTENIFNGFTDNYKITNYKIYYKDNTTANKPINTCSIVGNIATIGIYEYNTGIDYIEIFDSNYTIPFISIDVSNLEENKLIQIIQKIRIE